MEPIEEFDLVVQKFSDELADAKNQEEQDQISQKYDKIISDAESKLEKDLEERIQKEKDAMEAEFEEAQSQLIAQEEEDEKLLAQNEENEDTQKNYSYIEHTIKTSSISKAASCLSVKDVREYADHLNIDSKGREFDIIKRIKEFLETTV